MVSKRFLVLDKRTLTMISNISLYQFKNFADETKVALAQMNIIYGCNGKGKSTLLQSILLLSQTMRSDGKILNLRLNGEFINLERFDDVINRFAADDDKQFKIEITSDGDNICTVYEADEKPQLARLVDLKINGEDYLSQKSIKDSNLEVNKQDNKPIPTSDIIGLSNLKNLFYISADRKGPCNSVKRNDNITNNTTGVHGEYLIQLLYSRLDIQEKLTQEMSKIFKGASIKLPSKVDDDELKLFIDSSDNSDGFKPSNVGFGYSYVLPIIVQVLLAPPKSIIVIENPEAHLHPAAQSRLMTFLIEQMQQKSLQIFLETHSDHTINGVRLAVKQEILQPQDVNILFISRDEYDDRGIPLIEKIKVDKNGALSQYPDDFMDEWAKQASELL